MKHLVSARIDAATKELLEAAALEQRRSLSDLIAHILEAYADELEGPHGPEMVERIIAGSSSSGASGFGPGDGGPTPSPAGP